MDPVFIKIGQQVPFGDIQHLTEASQLIVRDQPLIVLDFADHLLVDTDIHGLQLCGQLLLTETPQFPVITQAFIDDIFVPIK